MTIEHGSYAEDGSWCYGPKNMASCRFEQRIVLMHRMITNAPKGVQVDHVDMNDLDNRKANLRLASNQQNQGNRTKQKNNTSGFKGVFRHSMRRGVQVWSAKITVNMRTVNLGIWTDPVLAARAYDEAALKHFGAFARGNFLEAHI